MSETRLPAHLEVAGLIRAAEAAGGFGTVIAKGERDAGIIMVVTLERGGAARLWERMPRLDGARVWKVVREEDDANRQGFEAYLARRRAADRDAWLIELDVPDAERLIADLGA